MRIPVELGAAVEFGVKPGEKSRGEPRGEVEVDELVRYKGNQCLVDMVREGGYVQRESPGLNRIPQPSRRTRKGI